MLWSSGIRITRLSELEINWKRSETHFESNIFQEQMFSLTDILLDSRILIVFEHYIVEMVKERFKQLHIESPNQYLEIPHVSNTIMSTRWRAKGLFSL